MAVRWYFCRDCTHKERYFDHEDKLCSKCNSEDLKRLMSVPMATKSCDKVDKYHNIDMERGIEDDLRKRNKKHDNDTIDDFVDKHGMKEAKKAGLVIFDPIKRI